MGLALSRSARRWVVVTVVVARGAGALSVGRRRVGAGAKTAARGRLLTVA